MRYKLPIHILAPPTITAICCLKTNLLFVFHSCRTYVLIIIFEFVPHMLEMVYLYDSYFFLICHITNREVPQNLSGSQLPQRHVTQSLIRIIIYFFKSQPRISIWKYLDKNTQNQYSCNTIFLL